jgi:hypothetical protein
MTIEAKFIAGVGGTCAEVKMAIKAEVFESGDTYGPDYVVFTDRCDRRVARLPDGATLDTAMEMLRVAFERIQITRIATRYVIDGCDDVRQPLSARQCHDAVEAFVRYFYDKGQLTAEADNAVRRANEEVVECDESPLPSLVCLWADHLIREYAVDRFRSQFEPWEVGDEIVPVDLDRDRVRDKIRRRFVKKVEAIK